ncbi:response regulator transcription factor [Bacillus sp. BRMEA1]|uniref:response regulator n=1 Tax=Neobacillus endophyticus TaxID=2738405 RepID=UPI001562F70F|nr:response regulator transcription factor [Neobacillus endophyticus]NRD76854.1 response regulator transcription factor [Neobacillus endophyticus]
MNVMIVDDQGIVRDGLKMLLSLNEEIRIIGEAVNGAELLHLLEGTVPDVILMDIRMPVMNGIDATKAVKEIYPNVKVIILTTFNEDEYIFNGLKNGADGFILKDSDLKEIIKAIKAAYEGTLLLHPEVTSKLIHALQQVPEYSAASGMEKKDLSNILTPREVEVVEQIMQGKSNKTISAALFLTEGTVKNYVSRILDKLELKSRAELIIYLKEQ